MTPDFEGPFRLSNQREVLKEPNLIRAGENVMRFTREFAWQTGEGGSRDHLNGLSRARELFEELSEVYGVEHAGFYPVVGQNSANQVGGYVVSRWVDGERCVDPSVSEIPSDQKGAARELLTKLSNYATSKQHQAMLTDIFKLGQYVYVPERDTLVLVDTEPLFEPEFGSVFAYNGLQPIAEQVLDPTEYADWHSKMVGLSDLSQLVQFDKQF